MLVVMMNTAETPDFINEQLVVEPAKPEDAADIYNVQRLTWIATYPNERVGISVDDVRARVEGKNGELIDKQVNRWRETINQSRQLSVARMNGKVVGFVAPFFDEQAQQKRVGALYVLPDVQGKGVGQALMTAALQYLGRDDDIYLHVASYNDDAINFYKKQGFVMTGKDVTGGVSPLLDGRHIPEVEMVLPSAY